MKLVAHLSRWMMSEGLSAAELTPGPAEAYVLARRAAGYKRHFLSVHGLYAKVDRRALEEVARPWPGAVA
jgi:hypothetical protein